MDLYLKDKVAIVAASSKGLGKAAALGLAREGVKLTICSRSKEHIERTGDEISFQTETEVLSCQCDVSKTEDIKAVVSQTIEKYSKIDIMINNAGGPPVGTFLDFSLEEWQKAIELNLFSTISFCNEVIPFMKRQRWGRIVNIASISVKQPIDGLILSNTVRAGVIGLAKTMSTEFAPYNVLINNICPGRIFTDRIKSLANQRAKLENKSFDEAISTMEKDIPIGRIGKPEELANLIVFLSSDRASYITGTTTLVDGGLAKGLM